MLATFYLKCVLKPFSFVSAKLNIPVLILKDRVKVLNVSEVYEVVFCWT
jgi:hypothetical protein